MSLPEAGQLTRKLLGSFPQIDLADLEAFSVMAARTLSRYPAWAGERAVDYVTRTSRFVPTIAELSAALENETRIPRYAAEFETRAAAHQIAPPRASRPTIDDLRRKHGKDWGLHPDDSKPKAPPLTLEQIAVKYSVPLRDVLALPDAPKDAIRK